MNDSERRELNRLVIRRIGVKKMAQNRLQHPEIASQGCIARLHGQPITDNPYDEDTNPWLYESWREGWTDTDNDPDAPKKDISA